MVKILRRPETADELAAIQLLTARGVLGGRLERAAPRAPRAPRAPYSGVKATAIIAALQERYPCEAVPYGAFQSIGKELGVSREYVRRIAEANEFSGSRTKAGPRVANGVTNRACGRCGKPMTKNAKAALCFDCRFVELPCAQCGKLKRVSAARFTIAFSEKRVAWRAAHNAPQSQGRVFCDRHCYGRWFGTNYGGGAQKVKRDAMKEPV